ncbi:hypothetical protein B0T16DRAFT_225388 [Cercophora newfieldiana]|uniref:Uncharacterized protein n=1 Tax=Cercophora newfieldiana TaxID=92897 RepID=A0AA39XXJ9_9PEZI|nr:hypothetical protein B0T16DRAFT_225388 [Cercophora newfieldiana]
MGNGLKYGVKPPFFRVYCDSSEATCRERLQLYFPESFNDIMKNRHLATSIIISRRRLPSCPVRLPHRRQGRLGLSSTHTSSTRRTKCGNYKPSHLWFYKKGMTQEDVIVFKLYDNLASEATVCPHSAFIDPTASPTGARRSSIEVKIIVLG